ncbi:hypothetical protein QOZ80_4BG0336170 [Eleusine coracana subsp. coracana]|nr:hypothetical protein QOZ80_4BG0336170 [Eleusine coracana subsp. coracana]
MAATGREDDAVLPASLEVQVQPPPSAGRREMGCPETVSEKIEEGKHKVKQMAVYRANIDREIEMLEKVVEGMESEMDYELDLALHCGDVEIMRRARQRCVPRASLSEVEVRALRDIRDLAASAIADYTTNVGPVPDYDRPINPLSDTIHLPLPSGLAGVSASRHRLAGQ